MARVDPEDFGSAELALVYIAARTREARTLERLLTENGVSYTLGPEPFLRTSIFGFRTEHAGLGFYVAPTQAEFCRELIRRHQLGAGLVEAE